MQLAGRQRSTLVVKTSKNSICLYLFPRAVYAVPLLIFTERRTGTLGQSSVKLLSLGHVDPWRVVTFAEAK